MKNGIALFLLVASLTQLAMAQQPASNDGTQALNGQGFAVWNTEEGRAMLDWARTYNAGVSADKRVTFTGFDMQVNKPGKKRLLTYLKRTAPAAQAAQLDSVFSIEGERLLSQSMTQTTVAGKAAQDSLKALKVPYNDLYRLKAFFISSRCREG